MALRFVDSFDYYNTSQIERKWTEDGLDASIVSSPVRNGAGAARMNNGSVNLAKTLDDQATWIVGFGFRTSLFGSAGHVFFRISDVGTAQASLRVNPDGTLEVRQGTSTEVAGGRSSLALRQNIWYFIEMKVTIANSIAASSCQVRVNGEVWLTVDTAEDLQATANATADVIKWVGQGSTDVYLDDVYICDGTGGQNDDFLGDVQVETLFPDADGATNDFTRSAGANNWELVDENPADDDTTYVESSTVAHDDLYTFDDLTMAPVTIFGVQANVVAKKDDSGSRTIKILTRPTSVTIEGGVTHSPSEGTYLNFEQMWEDDPQAVAAWTESTLNASEFGVTIEA